MSISIQTLVQINTLMDDLWERKVTPENFEEWRNINGKRILDARVHTGVTVEVANAKVEVF